jgi:large subunit ribosomal protein L28
MSIWQALFYTHPGVKSKISAKKSLLFWPCSAIIYKLSFSKHKQGGASAMAKCQFCDKDVAFGIQVSHSHRRSNRTWKPNVKRVKAIVDGTPKHVYVCTRCLRSGKVTRAV